ncbi:energy-coupling factor transporter transmembrane protein EcfT [Oceanispirochaeta sp.]|jgi:energy-coupling factor transport system permease protein|uniref:energy-coupling factor transporter transmembrane component T family protein n=1 Tax=Oceanispirochaeta sp. TaxID=2035350 RepID=UPI0026395B28|nr:energy-coupling factor transporter transmembrane component T [Oceanispirochaeta sp.]MDA3957996.1 energy-coupling factor transporter transmembrane component T [Oceanispirochaeta sp.]
MSQSNFLSFKDRKSLLNRTYPFVKLIWVFMVALGLFTFKTPISGAVLFSLILLMTLTAGKIHFMEILRSGFIVFGLGFILMIFHFFIDPGTTVFSFGFLKISDYGLIQGPVFFFRLSVIVLASFLLIWTTDTRDLMTSLVKVGMPYRYAFTIFLALRFLPLIQKEVEAVKAAHSIRGRTTGSGLGHRIKLWQRYVFTILVNGIRKAEITADALECRAFGYKDKRTYLKDVHFKKTDILLPLITGILLFLLIYMEHTSWRALFGV